MTGEFTEPSESLALKEWGAAVHALLQGRQTVLLRKGGIHEKRFVLRGSQFWLYPTVAHSHAGSTRPEHADLLPPGAADVTGDAVVVRASVSVVEAIEVTRPENIAGLERVEAQLRSDNATLLAELEQVRNTLRDIHGSLSWRLTRPLRAVHRIRRS